MAVREIRIDFKYEGMGADPVASEREGSPVTLCGLVSKAAEDVVVDEEICINGLSGKVTEVGRTEINDDGSSNPRTVLSP